MKRKKNILEELTNYPYFDKEKLKTEIERFGLSKHSADAYLKDNSIVRLKRDFYIHKNQFDKEKSNLSYIFYIANNLRLPSYVSMESSMQFYGLMTETVTYAVISITNKVTRSYNTKLGKFIYHSIKDELFDFYETYTKGDYKFAIATNFKSIFDYLYFFTDRFRKQIDNSVFDLLRIDIQELSIKDKKQFNRLIKNYTKSGIRI